MNAPTRFALAQLMSIGWFDSSFTSRMNSSACAAVGSLDTTGILKYRILVFSTINRSRKRSTPSLPARKLNTERKPLAAALAYACSVGWPPVAKLLSKQMIRGTSAFSDCSISSRRARSVDLSAEKTAVGKNIDAVKQARNVLIQDLVLRRA